MLVLNGKKVFGAEGEGIFAADIQFLADNVYGIGTPTVGVKGLYLHDPLRFLSDGAIETRLNVAGYVTLEGAISAAATEVVARIAAGDGAGTARFEIKQGKLTGVLDGNHQSVNNIGDIVFERNFTGSGDRNLFFQKSRGTAAAPIAVIIDDYLGHLRFYGHDGTNYIIGAEIFARVSTTPGTNDMGTKLVVAVTPDGGSATVEALEIDQNKAAKFAGAFGIASTTPQAQQAHIIDADGLLADITTKFNTLLAALEGFGFLAAV